MCIIFFSLRGGGQVSASYLFLPFVLSLTTLFVGSVRCVLNKDYYFFNQALFEICLFMKYRAESKTWNIILVFICRVNCLYLSRAEIESCIKRTPFNYRLGSKYFNMFCSVNNFRQKDITKCNIFLWPLSFAKIF